MEVRSHGIRQEKAGRTLRVHQLVESYLVDGKPRQRVLLHLGRYPTVDPVLVGWPKEVVGLRRYAGQRRDKAEQLTKDSSSQIAADAALKRAQKAESLADDIAGKAKKLQDLREQGKV
jgi:hypothetical protein